MQPLRTPGYSVASVSRGELPTNEHVRPLATRVSLSEILASLSHALDLGEGQPSGHTVRTCIIGMRIAEELGIAHDSKSALYNALLLKDAGCSSNASQMCELFGSDDRAVKPRMKFVDWQKTMSVAIEAAKLVGQDCGVRGRVSYFLDMARAGGVTARLIRIRCERGEGIALRLGFTTDTAGAIRSLDEHWNGGGFPDGIGHEEIPLLSRIALLAQTLEAFNTEHGLSAALAMARKRSGRWFDPRLVRVVLGWKEDVQWWRALNASNATEAAIELEPAPFARLVNESGLDEVALAFADIVDAKSPYTYQHSSRVAAFACAIAEEVGYVAPDVRLLNRAALLHDVGKLGISSRILERPDQLTVTERAEMERHPVYTWQILRRVTAFADFARTAALHHERLDASGYPWKLGAADLNGTARILCVADVYAALTAHRPYRAGMARDAALRMIGSDSGSKLCSRAVEALAEVTTSPRELMAS